MNNNAPIFVSQMRYGVEYRVTSQCDVDESGLEVGDCVTLEQIPGMSNFDDMIYLGGIPWCYVWEVPNLLVVDKGNSANEN